MNYLNRLMGQGELVVFLTRRHGSCLLPPILLTLLLCGLVGGATYGLWLYFGEIGLVALGALGLPLAWLAWRIVVWQNELYVVTNRRVITLRGVINKDVADSSLEKVNDILLHQPFLGRVFNFGNIEILTASEGGVNRLDHIASPLGFKSALVNAKQALDHPQLPPPVGAPPPATDPASLLLSLKTLYDQGILTEDEYQAKKADLLGRL